MYALQAQLAESEAQLADAQRAAAAAHAEAQAARAALAAAQQEQRGDVAALRQQLEAEVEKVRAVCCCLLFGCRMSGFQPNISSRRGACCDTSIAVAQACPLPQQSLPQHGMTWPAEVVGPEVVVAHAHHTAIIICGIFVYLFVMTICRIFVYLSAMTIKLLPQVRSRACAEALELRGALDAASKDKATLSEQLAVLKTQLCFALQVGGVPGAPSVVPFGTAIFGMRPGRQHYPTATLMCWWRFRRAYMHCAGQHGSAVSLVCAHVCYPHHVRGWWCCAGKRA